MRMDQLEILEKDGQQYAVPSESYKRELMEPEIRTCQPANHVIRRYLKIDRFKSMIEGRMLYFPRVDRFNDPWEGSFAKPSKVVTDESALAHLRLDELEKIKSSHAKFLQKYHQKLFFVSCWNGHADESEALWNLYTGSDDGVAIESTVGKLCSLRPKVVRVGEVEMLPVTTIRDITYIDYSKDSIAEGDCNLWYKRRLYRADEEIRSAIFLWNLGAMQTDNKDLPAGIEVEMNPGEFIQKIILKPKLAMKLFPVVQTLLKNARLSIPICLSVQDAEPDWTGHGPKLTI